MDIFITYNFFKLFGNFFIFLSYLLDNLPNSLTHLKFNNFFDNNVDYLPNLLTHLTFGINFNKPINNLPQKLLYLELNLHSIIHWIIYQIV